MPLYNFLRGKEHWWIMLLAFAIRLAALPLSETVDSDAVSRTFMAYEWIQHPYWISHGIWLPFHQYLNGFVLLIYPSLVYTPVLMNILVSVISIWPVYQFSALLFSQRSAWLPALLLAVSPVFFRNSLMAMSEITSFCLTAFAMYFIQLTLIHGRLRDAVFAGAMMFLSAGFRYEAWVLAAIFFLLLLLNGRQRQAFVYAFLASIFPIIWMAGNYLHSGDLLSGISGANHFNLVQAGINDDLTRSLQMARAVFFLYSLNLALGFLVFPATVVAIILKRASFDKVQKLWLVPFACMFMIMTYKAVDGTLLLQHRFSITLLVCVLPFSALIIEISERRALSLGTLLLAVSILPTASLFAKLPIEKALPIPNSVKEEFAEIRFFRQDQAMPIPVLENEEAREVLSLIKSNCQNCPLILDFMDWQSTYFIALNAENEPTKVLIMPGTVHERINWERVDEYLGEKGNTQGLLLLKNGSELSARVYENQIHTELNYIVIELIHDRGELKLFRFQIRSN